MQNGDEASPSIILATNAVHKNENVVHLFCCKQQSIETTMSERKTPSNFTTGLSHILPVVM